MGLTQTARAQALKSRESSRPIRLCLKNRSLMKRIARFSFAHSILILCVAFSFSLNAQAPPPVPSTFQDLYTQQQNYLDSFNATLAASGPGVPYPTLRCGALKSMDSNIGPQLLTGDATPQLNALKAMGVQAIMLQVGFPPV